MPTGVQNSHSVIGWERKEKKTKKKEEEEKERNKSRIMKRIFKNPLRMMTMFFLTDVLNPIATLLICLFSWNLASMLPSQSFQLYYVHF